MNRFDILRQLQYSRFQARHRTETSFLPTPLPLQDGFLKPWQHLLTRKAWLTLLFAVLLLWATRALYGYFEDRNAIEEELRTQLTETEAQLKAAVTESGKAQEQLKAAQKAAEDARLSVKPDWVEEAAPTP